MKTEENYWKKYWGIIGKSNCSNIEADRGTTCVYPHISQWFEKQFLNNLSPRSTDLLLDAGCGTGNNFCKFSKHVKGIVGIDISQTMVERAKETVTSDKLTNCSLVIGSLVNLGVKNRLFDKAICISVLQYLNDEECAKAIKELLLATKKSGTIILHVKNLSSLYGISLYFVKKCLAPLINREITPDYYRTANWYEKCVIKSGGRVIEFQSFGLFNLSHMPRSILKWMLKTEMKIRKNKFLKRRGVNLQLTIKISQ